LQWNTFLGGNGDDYSYAITADGSGSVYVAGYSDATWGPPVRAHDPGANFDAFAAKLNSSGILQWNTFLGGSGADPGRGIAVDGSGNVYVAGYSSATWGSPLRAFGGGTYDAFAAKLPPDKTYADTAGVCGGNLPCYTTIGNALGGVMDTVGSVDIYAATYAEDVSLASGVTLNLLGATTLNGNLTIGSGTTFNATSGTFSLTGNFTNSGTFNANSGTVTFNGTTNLSGNTTFKAVTINSGKTVNAGSTTTTIQGSISNSGTFNGETGTVILSGSYSRTLSGSGTYNFNNLTVDASGGTVNLSINVTIHVAGDFTKSAGSFTCNSASDATINTCTLDFNGGGTSSFSWTNSSVLPWNITIQSGTTVNLGASNSTFTLRGNLGGDGTLSASGGTITFDTVTASLISGSKTFNNVTANSPTTLQLGANAIFGYKGTFTIGSGGSFGATANSPAAVTIAGTSARQLPSGATTLRNLTINSGSSLTAPSSLSIAGDFMNSGTFTHNNGTVTFNGSGTQNLTANVATAFYNLTVNSGVTLVETVSADNASIATGGTLTNGGSIRKSQNIGTTGNYTFGLAGGPINSANLSINVTTDNFTSIQVDRKDSSHPNATDPLKTGYYWTLTPDGSGTVNLTLPVTFTTDTKDRVCRYTGSEQVWDCDYSSHTANSITRDGVTTFSDWAAGDDVGPTAITLSSLTARPFAPQATLFRWQWLALAGAVVFCGGAVARRLLGR
nr:SBBP repeat-containing protein [Chloroflexota bacterium]